MFCILFYFHIYSVYFQSKNSYFSGESKRVSKSFDYKKFHFEIHTHTKVCVCESLKFYQL